MSVQLFSHDAMATTFDFRVRHDDNRYAAQAVAAAFTEVDRVESCLSRFREGSDIWRINHAGAGEQLQLCDETHVCLLRAAELTSLTRGAFDVTLGRAVDRIRAVGGSEIERPALEAALSADHRAAVVLHPQSPQVEVSTAGGSLDLGAIGKGFALDRAALLLGEWAVDNVLLGSGGSSFLALVEQGGTPWSLNLAGQSWRITVRLRNVAIGASGTTERGRHIIDPLGGGQRYSCVRAWAVAPDAATADALSTAWMVLQPEEIEAVVEQAGNGHAALLEAEDGAIRCCESGQGWRALSQTEVLTWG